MNTLYLWGRKKPTKLGVAGRRPDGARPAESRSGATGPAGRAVARARTAVPRAQMSSLQTPERAGCASLHSGRHGHSYRPDAPINVHALAERLWKKTRMPVKAHKQFEYSTTTCTICYLPVVYTICYLLRGYTAGTTHLADDARRCTLSQCATPGPRPTCRAVPGSPRASLPRGGEL